MSKLFLVGYFDWGLYMHSFHICTETDSLYANAYKSVEDIHPEDEYGNYVVLKELSEEEIERVKKIDFNNPDNDQWTYYEALGSEDITDGDWKLSYITDAAQKFLIS